MTVLPIVERELRVASRRWGSYLLRLTAATIAIAMATIIYLASSRSSPAELGKTIFMFLSGFAFLYALLVGVRVTSDCISSEKREGTLGLLFLTDLKGIDIVLGKLVAFGLDSFYALLATLPVLAIPILLGSVTLGELWRVAVCLVSTALFSICAGLLVSSCSVRERKAAFGTFLLILFITAGIPLILAILGSYLSLGQEIEMLFALSPSASIFSAFNGLTPGTQKGIYWISIACTLSYALLATIVSAIIVPRVWHDAGKDRKVSSKSSTDDALAKRGKSRQAMLDVSPTYWLASRSHLRALWLWVFLAFVAGCWLWGYYENRSDMLSLATNFVIMYFIHGIFKVFVVSESVRIYAEEDKQGALELLLCTPISVGSILKGQLTSLFRYFRWPALTLLGLDLFFIVIGQSTTSMGGGDLRTLTTLFIVMVVAFVFDCVALGLVGLWNGLIARNSRSAMTSTMARILVLPWIVFGILNLTFALTNVTIAGRYQLWLWVGLGLMANGVFGWQAWEQLRSNLRIIASARFEKQPAKIWAKMGRAMGRVTFRVKPVSELPE